MTLPLVPIYNDNRFSGFCLIVLTGSDYYLTVSDFHVIYRITQKRISCIFSARDPFFEPKFLMSEPLFACIPLLGGR